MVARCVLMAVACVAAGFGCTKDNPEFCDADGDCGDGFVCDLSVNRCGAEDPPDAAPGVDAPAGDIDAAAGGDPDAAVPGACVDADCDSGICRIDADECVPLDEVIYVAADGSQVGGCGTQAVPCELLADAIAKLTADRTYIRMAPGNYNQGASHIIDGKTARILADLAELTVGVNGIMARGGANVTVVGLSVVDSNVGFVCEDSGTSLVLDGVLARGNVHGIVATGGTVTVARSDIRNNDSRGFDIDDASVSIVDSTVRENQIGVDVNCASPTTTCASTTIERSVLQTNQQPINVIAGAVRIENNIITGNTMPNSGPPVIGIGSSTAGTFSFNTVVKNAGNGPGNRLLCSGDIDAVNNIVQSNVGQWLPTGCSWTYSNVAGDLAGEGNIDAPPAFVNEAGGDFHLMPTSRGVDEGDPAAAPSIDIDGDGRPQGGRVDMGADEVVP